MVIGKKGGHNPEALPELKAEDFAEKQPRTLAQRWHKLATSLADSFFNNNAEENYRLFLAALQKTTIPALLDSLQVTIPDGSDDQHHPAAGSLFMTTCDELQSDEPYQGQVRLLDGSNPTDWTNYLLLLPPLFDNNHELICYGYLLPLDQSKKFDFKSTR